MAQPAQLASLRARAARLADLEGVARLLMWDQSTYMPPAGAHARGERLATLQLLSHETLTDPGMRADLEVLTPWAAEQEDRDADDVRLVQALARDVDKAVRVPGELAAEMSRVSAIAQADWMTAREKNDFAAFADSLERQVDLRHRYAACFPEAVHPYDVCLDDYEPGLTTGELLPLFARLGSELTALVKQTASDDDPRPFADVRIPAADQRRALTAVLEAVGYEENGWRLDETTHPFAQGIGQGDVRLTTHFDEDDFGFALYAGLHEFGHGLYEAGPDPGLYGTTLESPVSLGVHESQSRLWENIVGRGRPFCRWLAPRLAELLPDQLGGLDGDGLFRSANAVCPTLVRIHADETTYNLHIGLRFDIEVRLIEGKLAVRDLPAAWNEAMHQTLGVEVPDDVEGVLQDIHWSLGSFGYFPTYTLGNLISAQLWERVTTDLPDVDEQLARGEFGPLRGWLHEHVHRHGRKFPPRELLERVTGQELRLEPFLDYLRAKLRDAGRLAA